MRVVEDGQVGHGSLLSRPAGRSVDSVDVGSEMCAGLVGPPLGPGVVDHAPGPLVPVLGGPVRDPVPYGGLGYPEMVVAVDFALNSPMPDASTLYDDVYVNYSNPIPGLR